MRSDSVNVGLLGAGAYAGPGRGVFNDPVHPGMPVRDRANAQVGRLDAVVLSTKGAIEALLVRTAAPVGLRTRLKRLSATQARIVGGEVISSLSRAQVFSLPDAR